ncbi:DUF6080 domain-containing protein [Chryseobacterium sp. MFBS3-17]|uniref:DUF6080 domain-containing protein n=1 Tax=Chryseobacterium sp. MFBS3-17 TaxID=2886689 RepID=UPI001D0F0690|nr:DUF6080 domain-containing protein [Chryseobacterium sp. MFBS3-17]MCC2590499.1 DUF6080 domain-containing protein [Chryseobacterium sp. MFBS3-17]
MKLTNKLSGFLKTVFPQNKTEWSLLLFFLAAYGFFAAHIALNYRIIFDNRIPWDAYFSFDNRAIVMTGGGFERHPLAHYFFDMIRNVAKWISGGKYDADFRLTLALLSTAAVSFTMLHLFKYLRNIIRLPVWICIFLVLFFSLFSTSILLSFTPETYTYTLFLLVLFNYYAALRLRKNQPVSPAALILGTVTVGGLTITNAAKVFIPVLFENGLFRRGKKFLSAAVRGIVAVAVFALLYLNRLNFDVQRIFTKTGEQYEKFSNPKITPLWDMITSWFWGGNMLFPSFVLRDYHNKKRFEYKAIFMDVYTGWAPYLFAGLVFGLVIWGYVTNFKNKLVQILMVSFLVDVIIHVVMKFGLHTAYIYGGHFIFVVPLMLGWLISYYKDVPLKRMFILAVAGILFIFLLMNNAFRVQEFLLFLKVFYA